MLKTVAIKSFLANCSNIHLTSLYSENMEVQVNVAKDNGERINDVYKGKRWVGWKGPDGSIWKSFRIPWNADRDPQYEDKDLTFDLTEHVEAIGMTGWDWKNRRSLWVGFDFDSMVNHKEGLSKEDLEELVSKVSSVEWITLLKSTSGHGYHIYIHFDNPIETQNHSEHAAIARSLLSVLTIETGFDFSASVDCCGGVLWCYHRKQEGTDGLSLLKKGNPFPSNKIPVNWKDHISVTSKRTKKIKSSQGSNLDELIASQQTISLDAEHYRILKWFTKSADRDYWWDDDHHMLVCHTLDLAKVYKEYNLKGIFYTDSSGSTTQNCFCFPGINGSWVVRRHGIGTKEHSSWVTDQSGWTRCLFNAPAELESAIKTNKGVRNSKGEYIFDEHLNGFNMIKQMNINFTVPEIFTDGPARLMSVKQKGDNLIVIIDKLANEKKPEGWLANKQQDKWEIVLDLPKTKRELTAPDSLIRHTISQGVEAGWYIKTKEDWVLQSKSNVLSVLTSQEEFDKSTIEILVGKSILSPWAIVNIPFADEYAGNRTWNKDAACFKIKPEQGDCLTWLKIIKHCGSYLDDVCKNNEWCITNGIKDGGDYLLCWLSSMVQNPSLPLPYLFFVGEQNTGKSTLHEALGQFIFKKGYTRADYALTNPSGFNAEVANAVLCIVEETDLRSNKEAGNRIKDWVTGKTISIRALYKNAYDLTNTTHWVQCANDANYCPILSGDTRIMVIRVPKPEKDIPKELLFKSLENESSQFLNLLLSIELPEPNSRLAIPCLSTLEKEELEVSSKNELEIFVSAQCKMAKGNKILFEVFYAKFINGISADSRSKWTQNKVARDFPKNSIYCKGKLGSNNATYVGNLCFNEEDITDKDFIYKQNSSNGRLEEVKC